MPSSITGYEYDIFISYRQKDNRSRSDRADHENDGWVTEFVANLRKELEVTCKEEISVYFDENPYDGITDGHEVNDSLADKLKCLIFIPIISHSYCDTKSYAWNNEFLYFKQLASADKFGLKVRLQNGNVTSRIVPVRINEPDIHDSLLLVKEIGGILRSIDFIFRTPGVNRPLQANEDHPQDNRNKTYYRDQINKVANLIKDIIQSMKGPGKKEDGVYPREGKISELVNYATRWKRTLVVTVSVALLVFVYFLFSGNFDSISTPGPVRTTIAVIPFKVFGGEEESRYFAEGVSEDIRLNISLFPELKVKSRTSVERYRDNPKSIPEIAKELNVLYILEGSAQKVGNNIRVTVNLIDTRADVNLWSEKFEQKFENVFEIQNKISQAIARALKATLTPDISKRISRTPTNNFEVYDLFLRARQASRMYSHSHELRDLDLSINLLKQSVREDPRFALGYAWLAGVEMIRSRSQLSDKVVMDSILWLANKALEIDSTVVEASFALSQLYHLENDDVNALRYTYKSLEHERIDSVSVVDLVKRLGSIYSRIGDIDRALVLFDEILKLNPKDGEVLQRKFLALAAGHRIEQLKELMEQTGQDDPFADLVRSHVALEGKQYAELERIYHRQDFFSNGQMDLFDQYALVYATALRKNGKEAEALKLARSLEEKFAGDNYFNAQLQIFYGRLDEGLKALSTEEVGWYNLNLCRINPVFEKVSKDPRFKAFLERNADRLINQRDRIHQLEDEGYLPGPEEFLGKTIPERVLSI